MTAAEPHTGNYLHQSSVTLSSSDGMDEEESAESLLASVKEQEQQFALLSKEIEEERKSVAKQLKTNKSVGCHLISNVIACTMNRPIEIV